MVELILGVGFCGPVINLCSVVEVMWLSESLMVTQISVLTASSATGGREGGVVLVFNPRQIGGTYTSTQTHTETRTHQQQNDVSCRV